MNHSKPLECSCCPRPFAELVTLHNGEVALLIKARHDSNGKHNNVLTLAQLQAMLKEYEKQEARHNTDNLL
jgi:hypothetical protein